MEDTITLKRTVEGEFAPQYWTMSGGEFDAMLEAVKNLPRAERTFVSLEKAWSVKYTGIQALRNAGYTVKKEADVRVSFRNEQESVVACDAGADVTVIMDYRRPKGNWSSDIYSHHFEKTIHFDFPLDAIATASAEVRANDLTQKFISEKYMDAHCHNSAIRTLAWRAVMELHHKAQARYMELIKPGKRTEAEFVAAVETVWSEL